MRPKIVFVDMEGTLLRSNRNLDNGKVAPSAWTVLAKAISEECYQEEEASKDKWLAKGYASYMHWMLETVRIHAKHGLTQTLFERVLDGVEETPGIEAAFKAFREWNSITVLVSGGIKYLADRVQRKLRIDHSFCGCEYFFDKKTGLIEHVNLLPSDIEGKVDFMKLMVRDYGVSREECAFVGDGKNDVKLAAEVGCSIAFNAQVELKAVASIVIEQEDDHEDFAAVVSAIDGWRT